LKITEEEMDFLKKILKKKQEELGLTDEECNLVVANLIEYLSFSDEMVEFGSYILEILNKKLKEE